MHVYTSSATCVHVSFVYRYVLCDCGWEGGLDSLRDPQDDLHEWPLEYVLLRQFPGLTRPLSLSQRLPLSHEQPLTQSHELLRVLSMYVCIDHCGLQLSYYVSGHFSICMKLMVYTELAPHTPCMHALKILYIALSRMLLLNTKVILLKFRTHKLMLLSL